MNQIKEYSTKTDLKDRWAGILENPYVSKFHRHLLDGFKVRNLAQILSPYKISNLLDVGCGFGEYTHLGVGKYFGIDNSFPRVRFAQRNYPQSFFSQASAIKLPFKDNSFEAALLANTIHHLSDQEFFTGFSELIRVSKKYIIIDDCVKSSQQTSLSKFFYSLDRGTMFRTASEIEQMLESAAEKSIAFKSEHTTFPGLYRHAVFVVTLRK